MKGLKGLFVVILFIIIVSGSYYFAYIKNTDDDNMHYYDEFNHLDRDFWYVGEWKTMFKAYDKVDIDNDILTVPIAQTDRGAFLLSKAISLKQGDVITIKRRVKFHYENDKFSGGLAIVETNDSGLKPLLTDHDWSKSIGNALALVEYVHFYGEDTKRPGNDNIRVMSPNWQNSKDYALLDPIFDEWFEEKLIYDTRTNEIKYSYGTHEVVLKGVQLNKPYIRVFMHGYGWHTGHTMKIDWVDIDVKTLKE